MNNPSGSQFALADARLCRRIRQRKEPVQARSRATIDALLEATLQVLVREGYARLTTTRVAERAGVSVGTLYQYFPDKRSLVTALKIRYFGLMIAAMREAMDASEVRDSKALLERALGALLAVKRENIDLTRALREPMAESAGHAFLREGLEQFAALLVPRLKRVLPSRHKVVERRATLLVAAIEGVVSHAVYQDPTWLGESWFLDELVAMGVAYLAR